MPHDLAAAWTLVLRNTVLTASRFVVPLFVTALVSQVAVGAAVPATISFGAGHRETAEAVDTGDHAAADGRARRLARLNEAYACSHRGLADSQVPVHAVVLSHGRVRLTTFDEGWAVHQGERPGTLLSVCAR